MSFSRASATWGRVSKTSSWSVSSIWRASCGASCGTAWIAVGLLTEFGLKAFSSLTIVRFLIIKRISEISSREICPFWSVVRPAALKPKSKVYIAFKAMALTSKHQNFPGITEIGDKCPVEWL